MPLPWRELGFPDPFVLGGTTITRGNPAWEWDAKPPNLPIAILKTPEEPSPMQGWDIDHVVLLVNDLEHTITTLESSGVVASLKMAVQDRPTAFFRVGPVLEVIESPVRSPALYGVALTTEEPLETVILRWRSLGRDVTDPKPALQPGRRIFTVRDIEAGLAVMNPEQAVK